MKKPSPLSPLVLALAALSTPASAGSPPPPAPQARPHQANVVFITLDGVRWEEVFQGVDPGQSVDSNPEVFSFLKGTLSGQGVLIGDKARGETVQVANKHLNSLPGYQSIMAGAPQPCGSNFCGRIPVETMQERITHDLALQPEEVATISSWEKIAYAVEHVEGTTFVNAGNRPLLIGGREPLNPEAAAINAQQAKDPAPWKDARKDKYTFAHALNYLKAKKPRFLYISLNDSDEWGHRRKYDEYLSTLRQHDSWIKELSATLASMGDYGKNTTLIITTDHGRGSGNDWHEHGAGYQDSGAVWIYGQSPYTAKSIPSKTRMPAASVVYSHLDIRPTIEASFGLEPKLDGVTPPPGRVIRAIVGHGVDGSQPQRVSASTAPPQARPRGRAN
jgi:hypothetical protein